MHSHYAEITRGYNAVHKNDFGMSVVSQASHILESKAAGYAAYDMTVDNCTSKDAEMGVVDCRREIFIDLSRLDQSAQRVCDLLLWHVPRSVAKQNQNQCMQYLGRKITMGLLISRLKSLSFL